MLTSKAIRSGESGERFSQAVIIAMTADVMDSDKKLFQQAGMNDFIPKPLDVDDFKQVLLKWLAQM